MNEHQEIARADSADAILSHPLIAEALDAYKQELIAAWSSSTPRSADDRERLYLMLVASEHFRAYMTQVSTTGKLLRAKVRKPTLVERTRDMANTWRP